MKVGWVFLCLLLASGVYSHHDKVIDKNCSDLWDSKRGLYQIWTETEVERRLESCEQEWNSEDQSLAVGYINKPAEIQSPVVSLTHGEILLDSCVNLTLIVHCERTYIVKFLVHPSAERNNLQDLNHFISSGAGNHWKVNQLNVILVLICITPSLLVAS